MLNRIARIHHSLTSSEQRIAKWVLENPHRVVANTLADIAAEVNVSEPTVVRFCRAVGSKGFRNFKVQLAQHLATSDHVVHADVSIGDDATQVIAKVIGRSVKELVGVQQRLNASVLNQVAERLANAARIDFYGIGASGYVVADAQNKFFRLGIPCSAYNDSATILQAAAITDASYAVVVVSKSGRSDVVIEAARIARANQASVVAITSPRSPLATAANAALLIDIDEDTGTFTPMSSRLAQLAVLDVLQVAVALRIGDSATSKLDLSKRILQSN